MDTGVLRERYELLQEKNSDIGEFLPVLWEQVIDLNAKKVIELGVRYGASTIAFLHALQPVAANGQLWSVDCSFPITDPETGIDLLSSQGPLGCVDYWAFLLGYDTSPMIRRMLPDKVDIVFIDTNHVYEETVEELSHFSMYVREGGRIILHDTNLETTGNAVTPQPPYPVRTAVEEFCEQHGYFHHFIDSGVGLGIIQL